MLDKFPWIFGIFALVRLQQRHPRGLRAFSRRGCARRPATANAVGLVTWSEISHNDTFLLEYLADNSWQPERLELSEATPRYCRTRYPAELAASMEPLWTSFLSLVADPPLEHHARPLGAAVSRVDQPHPERFDAETAGNCSRRITRGFCRALKQSPKVLHGLADLSAKWYDNPLWRRDALDMARTTASRALYFSMLVGTRRMEAWRHREGRCRTGSPHGPVEPGLARRTWATCWRCPTTSRWTRAFADWPSAKEINGVRADHQSRTPSRPSRATPRTTTAAAITTSWSSMCIGPSWPPIGRGCSNGSSRATGRSGGGPPSSPRKRRRSSIGSTQTPLAQMTPTQPRDAEAVGRHCSTVWRRSCKRCSTTTTTTTETRVPAVACLPPGKPGGQGGQATPGDPRIGYADVDRVPIAVDWQHPGAKRSEGATRRDFLKSSIAGGLAFGLPSLAIRRPASLPATGPNAEIAMAVVGLGGIDTVGGVGGRGRRLISGLREIPGVRIAAVCDVDRTILDHTVQQFKDRREDVTACTRRSQGARTTMPSTPL